MFRMLRTHKKRSKNRRLKNARKLLLQPKLILILKPNLNTSKKSNQNKKKLLFQNSLNQLKNKNHLFFSQSQYLNQQSQKSTSKVFTLNKNMNLNFLKESLMSSLFRSTSLRRPKKTQRTLFLFQWGLAAVST